MNRCLFENLTADEKYSVRLKIATRKYDVYEQNIIVYINLGERKEVQISKYRGKLGTQIKNNLFIKFFWFKKPDEIEREDVGRKWIDYNGQLLDGKYIYDTKDGYGIWVTNASFIYKAIEATWRYGENIMVLAPIVDLKYIITDNEIVGDKFEVKMHGSLTDQKTWYSLWELLGDQIVEEMPQKILDKYNGAKIIYDRYWGNKNIPQTEEINDKEGLLRNIIKRLFK